MHISYNKLTDLTGFSYRTLHKRLSGLSPVGTGRTGANQWESKEALPLLYTRNGKPVTDKPDDESEQLYFNTEKARLAKEQADGQALKNAMQRRELIPASEIAETWGLIVTAAKLQFLALPDRLSQMLETASTASDRRTIIEAEIKSVLEGLADEKTNRKGGKNETV